jgi:hypothetical protein
MTMGMREECKHFQSRTYESGEVARFCVLGNAPDQPWNCPDNCVTYERRFADVGWSHGTLVPAPAQPEPVTEIPIENRREVLDMASEIVNAVAPEMIGERLAELEALKKKDQRSKRFWRRDRDR